MNWPPQRILVATDFSDVAGAAVRAAAALARRTGAALDLVHVLPDRPDALTGFEALDALLLRGVVDPEKLRAQAHAALEAVARRLAPVEAKLHVVRGQPAAEILALRELLRVDLVALGGSGLRGLRRFVLGSVADRVLRRPGCPLLLVNHAPPNGELKTGVVAQEYPDRSTPWLELALKVAHDERGELVVLHVLPQRGYASDAHHVDLEPERAPEKLERLIHDLDGTVPVRIETSRGDAAQRIVEGTLKEGADLLVIGAERNRDGWPGRVTDRVARAGLPALLVVWPDAEADEEFEGRDA
jgi:nucleotide-binding universal stress UspA family protein